MPGPLAPTDLLARLVSETIACSPAGWERGELTIQSSGRRLTYQLRNEGHPDRAELSEDLRTLIDDLYGAMRRTGEAWTGARIRWWIEGEGYRCDTHFTCPPRA